MNRKVSGSVGQDVLFYCLLALVVIFAFLYYGYDTEGNIIIKGFSQWYDLPVHLRVANHFVATNWRDWFAHSPLNFDETFSYHFGADLLSAILLAMGLGSKYSMMIPILLFTFLGLLEARKYFSALSPRSVVDASLFAFIFLGGLGFLFLPSWWRVAFSDPNTFYPGYGVSNYFLTPLTQVIFAQRGPMIAMYFFFKVLNIKDQSRYFIRSLKQFIYVSLMALFQFHGVVALLLFQFFIQYGSGKREWLHRLGVTLIAGLIVYFGFYYSPTTIGYIRPTLLWLVKDPWRYLLSVVMSFGLFAVLYPLALRPRRGSHVYDKFPLVVWLCINLIQFQPNPWDNMKVLWFALPFLSLAVVSYLKVLAGGRKSIYILGLMALTATGVLSYAKLVFTDKNDYVLNTHQELITAANIAPLLEGKKVLIESVHKHLIVTQTHAVLYKYYYPVLATLGHDLGSSWSILNTLLLGENYDDYFKKNNISFFAIYKQDPYSDKEFRKLGWYMGPFKPIRPKVELLRLAYDVVYEDSLLVIFRPRSSNPENL